MSRGRKIGMNMALKPMRFLRRSGACLPVQPIAVENPRNGDLRWPSDMACRSTTPMIAAAALQADCDTLWSEDMQGRNGV